MSSQLQACCINFDDIIKTHFRPQYGLERRLPVALQHGLQFQSARRTERARNLPCNIETMTDAFSRQADAKERDDPQYAFRVNFVPLLANRPAGADQVIEFAKGTPGDAAASIAVIKEVDRRKYRAGG